MHPISKCAPSSSPVTVWSRRCVEAVVALGCLIAGATLVAIAMPASRPLSAGATVGQSVPQIGLLDFTASWCGPCQQMSPIIESLQRQGYPVYKVDVDQRPDLAKQFRITGMPTFLLVVNGQEVMRQTGATSEAQLRRMLLQIPEYQQAAQQARPAARAAQVASANPDFGPASSSVDLGRAQADPPRTVAANPAPSKPKIGLPFFNRDKEPKPPVANPAVADVRAQNPETSAAASPSTSDPMQASTQLRVRDKTGVNYGSGTIIHSRIGRTLVLTCGHVFRGADQSALVEVDVFDRNRKPRTYVGKMLQYDLAADIGVVAIPTQEVLPSLPLATAARPLSSGEALVSIGCNGVDLPSREQIAVTSLNFYEGPDTIQCTGFPVQGRSGGGLFRGHELVGVCIAADPTEKRGVYTGLKPIYELLTAAGCDLALPAAAVNVAATVSPAAVTATPVNSRTVATDADAAFAAAARAAGVTATQASDDLQAVFAQSPDAEVICIVRPRDPKAASRTVIIHQASSKLVGYLLDSLDTPAPPPAHTLAQTGLIPTTVQQPAAPTSMVQLGSVEPPAAFSRTLAEPSRPQSPRSR